MAIPPGVETVTITTGAPITLPGGELVRGHIRFIAPVLNLIDDENFIFGGESVAEVCEGEFTITLVPPDATGINPTGWTYTAIADFVNAPGWTQFIDITKLNPNVFLDDVIVLTPGDPTYPETVFVRKAGDTMTGALTLSGAPTADLHAATKKYVDDNAASGDFVQISGDTMTGPLILSGDPTLALGAAPKQYVDQAEADAVTAATAAAAAESVSLSGDTMTGPLILSGAPATALGAATKGYVDTGDDARVAVAGDTMTGALTLFGDPTLALHATTKQYTDAGDDARVAVAGDTMTGQLVLFGDPTVALGAAPKQYVDAQASAAQAAAAAESVSISGDTMTGALVLSADPIVALGAATKQFAEAEADAAQAAAAAESVSLSGDTMTGSLVLNANPTLALGAATKQYVDAAQAAAEANADAESVSIAGDTMTGFLTLNANPTLPLQAATKDYADDVAAAAQAAAEAAAAAESVSIAGDTMTGRLVLSEGNFDIDVQQAISTATGTGVIHGGEMNESLTPSSVDIGLTVGYIIDYITTPDDPSATLVTIPPQTVALDAGALARTVTWFLADSAGTIIQQADRPTNTQRRTHLQLGVISQTGGDIFIDQSTPTILKNPVNQLYDLMYALGAFNVSGNTISGVSASLAIQKTAGTIFSVGSNYFDGPVMTNDPHITDTPAQNPITIHYATRVQGSLQSARTTIDQTMYDNAGVITAVPINNDNTTIQRIYLVPANATTDQVIIQYGQQIFNTFDEALDVAGTESFIENQNLTENGIYIASMVVARTATDTTVDTRVKFLPSNKFGAGISGVSNLGDVLLKSGGTMTGDLVLAADPDQALEAATKQYVDAGDATAVKLTGAQTVAGAKTFSSIPILPAANPTVANEASRKGYVDGLDSANVKLTGAQTVAGVKTFSSIPVGPGSDPTTNNELTRKLYVDTLDNANVKLTGAQTVAGVKTFSSIPVGPTSNPTLDDQLTRKAYVDAGDAANASSISTLDGEVVKLTGNQSVGGIKTFTSIPVLPASNPVAANEAVRKQYVDDLDAANVKLTGTQSVAGLKTFTDALAITDGADVNLLTVEQTNTLAAAGVMKLIAGQATQQAFLGTYQGAATNSWSIRADGRYEVGDGAVARDTLLARTAAGVWLATSQVRVTGAAPSDVADLTRKDYVDGLDAANVKLTGAQTVNGVKTFGSIPVLPATTPTLADEATRKGYVDGLDAANVKLTGAQSIADVKTFTSIPVGPAANPTLDNQLSRKAYVDVGDAANAASISTLDGEVVKLTGAQTVAGVKTFSSIPVLPASSPTTANEATRKQYVDDLDTANVKLTGAQSVAGVKTFTSEPVFSAGIDVTAGLGDDRFAIKTVDTSRASTTTVTDDPHLTVAVEANATYVLEANCVWTQGGGGFRIDFTAPASAEMVWTDNDGFGILALGTDNTFSTTTGATMKGAMRIAGTSGTVDLRWAQNTSNAAATVLKEGSYLWLRRVA